MIRFANRNDISAIITLWSEAFGDSENEIRFFIDNKFEPENTLIYEYCGEAASMLFLLEGNMIIDGDEFPSYYLYAACTAKKCRGRGIMSELLNAAKTIAAERNKYFICLMPGNKSLFDFYERFGYKTVFSRKILNVKLSELTDYETFNEESVGADYIDKRKNAFSNYNRFEWDNNSIEFACKSHLLYNGIELNNCNGYALYSLKSSGLFVKEFAFSSKNLISSLKKLFDESGADKAEIYLPSDYLTQIGNFEIVDSAMAVSVKSEYDYLLSDLKGAYLGLTLD